jgi:hypothetical protein
VDSVVLIKVGIFVVVLSLSIRYNHGNIVKILVRRGSFLRSLEHEFKVCPLGLGLYLKCCDWALLELMHIYGVSRELCACVNAEKVLTPSSPVLICIKVGNIGVLQQMYSLGMFSLTHRVKDFGMPLLHLAVERHAHGQQQQATLSWLLSQGADPTLMDNRGHNSLMHSLLLGNEHAAMRMLESCMHQTGMVRTLLANKTNGRSIMCVYIPTCLVIS